MTARSPEEIKACCAAGYSGDLVAMLLGESYHPGGLRLTRHLLDRLGLTAGARLVDVASGLGTTSLLATAEHDVVVHGVDLSERNVERANAAAAEAGLAERTTFRLGDAERLPLADGVADALVCECALCTFPDKTTAIAEMARVLRRGGRVGITDVTAERDRLPEELTGLGAWIACVADARPLAEYADLLAAGGLRVVLREEHPDALRSMLKQVGARIELLRMTQREQVEALGLDFDRVGPVLGAARDAVESGVLGYGLLVAEKPA